MRCGAALAVDGLVEGTSPAGTAIREDRWAPGVAGRRVGGAPREDRWALGVAGRRVGGAPRDCLQVLALGAKMARQDGGVIHHDDLGVRLGSRTHHRGCAEGTGDVEAGCRSRREGSGLEVVARGYVPCASPCQTGV